MKRTLVALVLLLAPGLAAAQGTLDHAQLWCQLGGQNVSLQGLLSSTLVQQSYPNCTVTVYLAGTTTLATIYSNNLSTPTPLSNPFTANNDGSFGFWAAAANYDVVTSGGNLGNQLPSSFTYTISLGGSGGGGGISCQGGTYTVNSILVVLAGGAINCNSGPSIVPGSENSIAIPDNVSVANAGATQMKLASVGGVPSVGFNGPLSAILTAAMLGTANGPASLNGSAVLPLAQLVTSQTNCDGSHAVLGNQTCGTVGSTSIQTNTVANTSQTVLNFTDATAFHGLTFTWTNPSGGVEQPVIGGALDLATQTHNSITVNGVTCTLGSSCTPSGSSGSGLLNSQGPASPVTGTGSPATLYTFTIPGGTMSANSCIRVYAGFQHSTGTTSTTYTFTFGSASSSGTASGGTGNAHAVMLVCNNGATNSQFINAFSDAIIGTTLFSGIQSITSSVDTTVNQTVTFQFTVASPDAVTPKFWMVENLH
jgi:hypothetical protein